MPETTNWRGQIKRNCNREVCRTTANAILILRNTWGPHIVYDTFMGHVRMTGEPKQLPLDFQVARSLVGPWTDLHTTIACAYLEHPHELSLPPHLVRAAVEVVAASHPVHPVRDWLESLKWDQKPRLDEWMVTHAGVEREPHSTVVFTEWMISCVARVYRPGCQADHVLILDGEKGVGKSSFFQILGGDDIETQRWHAELSADLGSTNAVQSLFQKLIVELPELAAIKRTQDIERVKAFVTSRSDRIRKPYGRDAEDYPRQCVLGGSTNAPQWMREDDRRWWPLHVDTIDLEQLKVDRDQLFAEAVARYHSGEAWHITDSTVLASLKETVADKREADDWEPMVEGWLRTHGRQETSTAELLSQLCHSPTGASARSDQMRMGTVLTTLGWTRHRKRVNGVLKYVYKPTKRWENFQLEAPATVIEGPWGVPSVPVP